MPPLQPERPLPLYQQLADHLFCRSSNWSGEATTSLQAASFDRATSVEGGILGWTKRGLPIERDTS